MSAIVLGSVAIFVSAISIFITLKKNGFSFRSHSAVPPSPSRVLRDEEEA